MAGKFDNEIRQAMTTDSKHGGKSAKSAHKSAHHSKPPANNSAEQMVRDSGKVKMAANAPSLPPAHDNRVQHAASIAHAILRSGGSSY